MVVGYVYLGMHGMWTLARANLLGGKKSAEIAGDYAREEIELEDACWPTSYQTANGLSFASVAGPRRRAAVKSLRDCFATLRPFG